MGTLVNNAKARIFFVNEELEWLMTLTFDEHWFTSKQSGTVSLDISGCRAFEEKYKWSRYLPIVVDIKFTDNDNSVTVELWLHGAFPHGKGTIQVLVKPH